MMCRSIITALVFLLAIGISSASTQKVLKVPSQFGTIQAAVNAAGEGDTVLVSPGQYVENIKIIRKGIGRIPGSMPGHGSPSWPRNTRIASGSGCAACTRIHATG